MTFCFTGKKSARSESQPETPTMHNNEKLRSCCSTSRSAADRQTTGPNKREVISHVQTRSLDRSSPRVGRADNRPSSVNHTLQTDMKKLQDYLPQKLKKKQSQTPVSRKLKKQSQTPVISESPLYSPETLNALENAEKLIKEAQKRILEASYDVHSSPERDSSSRSGEPKAKDEESMYIRDVVATRFHEANESARIFTRVTAKRPPERPHKSPELRQRWHGPIVEENSKFYGKEKPPRRVMTKQKKIINPGDENEKPQNTLNVDKKKFNDSNSPQALGRETSKCETSKRENQRVSKNFKVQEGPRVDIPNELTITSVEKIDISPRPVSLPVRHNMKTYEFCHGEPRLAERDNETRINAESRDKPEVEEKSCGIRTKNRGAVSSSERGSSPDLVRNKSGRSIESEPLEGLEDARASCRDVRGNEKVNNPRQSFMEFLQRPENQKNVLTIDPVADSSGRDLEAENQFEIFDRAVQLFFNNLKRNDRARRDSESRLESPDEEFPMDRAKSNESDVLEKSDVDDGFSGDGKYSEDDWDLRSPDFGGLDNVLRKFDGSMSRVLRDARTLELLISEYSMDDKISSRSKSNSLIGDSGAIGGHRLDPPRDVGMENGRIHEEPTKDSSKNENSNISEFSGKAQASESSRQFSQAFSPLSQSENPRKESPLKRFLGKKIFSHPRYSTPLNNDLKIGKSFGNSENRNFNDFANFFNGIHRSKPEQDKKLSGKEEISRIEKINDDKIITASGGAENYSKAKKKMILNEIDKKCNFQSLFTRDRSSRDENLETSEKAGLAACSTHENARTSPTSLIQRSNSDEKTVTHEKNSISPKKVDEFLTDKNSGNSERSAAVESAESSKNQSSLVKNAESERSDRLSVNKTSEPLGSGEKSQKCENLCLVSKSENIVRSPSKNNSDMEEKTKELPADEEEAKKLNSASSSSGSSVRDRTSFDISTAYSEDFEEPSAISKKLNNEEKSNFPQDLPGESAPSEPEVSTKTEINSNKVEVTKELSGASLAKDTNSKNDIPSPEKSMSSYSKELSDRNRNGNINDAETNLDTRSIREKIAGENSVEPEQGKIAEMEENPKKNSDSLNSSVKSSKISPTSSLDEESGHDGNRTPEMLDLNSNAIACPRSPCRGMIFSCDCKQCKLRSKAKEMFEKCHNNTIETIFEEPLDEEKFVESKTALKIAVEPEREKHVEKTEQNVGKNSGNPEKGNFFMDIKSKLEEIVNSQNSLFIHSTPKKFLEDSICASKIFDHNASDPVASDSHSSRAIVTGEENYSEGELFLPSSCSYSLGEIRISELGTCTTSGLGVETSRRNTDTMRIFISRSLINTDSTDNTTNTINSLGEVQETEIESTGSN